MRCWRAKIEKEDKMKIIVANDKGGVGKSTIAHYCAVRVASESGLPRIVDMDGQPKLHRFFGKDAVQSLKVTRFNEDRNNIIEKAEPWDPIFPWLRDERTTIVDFGAQTWSSFVDWARRTNISQIVASEYCTVLVPITSDIESITGAIHILSSVRQIMPKARVAVLACSKDGPVEYLRGTAEIERLLRVAKECNAISVEIPALHSAGFAALSSRSVRFDQIETAASGDPTEIAELAPVPLPILMRAVNDVRAWLRSMDQIVLPFLLEPAVSQRTEVLDEEANIKIARGGPATEAVRAIDAGSPDSQSPSVHTRSMLNVVEQESFDEEYYLRMNPDVAAAVRRGEFASGFEHFVNHAGEERRLYRLIRRHQ